MFNLGSVLNRPRWTARPLVAFAVMTAAVAVSGVAAPGVAVSAGPIQVTVRSVAPSATDPAIDDSYGESTTWL